MRPHDLSCRVHHQNWSPCICERVTLCAMILYRLPHFAFLMLCISLSDGAVLKHLCQLVSRLGMSSSLQVSDNQHEHTSDACSVPRLQISTGDAGYMVMPPVPPEDDPPLNHADDGSHGVELARNLQDPNIAFGTVQLCAGPTRCMALRLNADDMCGLTRTYSRFVDVWSQAERTLHVARLKDATCGLHMSASLQCLTAPRKQLPSAVEQACTVAVPVPADPGFRNVHPQFGAAFANMYLYKRAQAAAQLGKPWILEEVGAVRN